MTGHESSRVEVPAENIHGEFRIATPIPDWKNDSNIGSRDMSDPIRWVERVISQRDFGDEPFVAAEPAGMAAPVAAALPVIVCTKTLPNFSVSRMISRASR
jgi:hypothetical protein